MIEPTVLVTYSLIVLGFVFIPGPATLLTVARATTSGAGITVGDFLRRNPTVLKWQGKVVGSIYCALGVRLAMQER